MLFDSNGVYIPNEYGIVKGISHRGYTQGAPENTMPAFLLSKKKGYKYVEADVAFTSDGVAVMLHDNTIDRTSNGSGNIANMTYAQALTYDFGSWYSADYAGTKIPTFKEFILLCKNVGLYPYIELKEGSYTQEQITSVVDAVRAVGMQGNVTYTSFSSTFLGYVKAAEPGARLGYCKNVLTESEITVANGLKTDTNEVFLNIYYPVLTANNIKFAIDANIPVEAWTIDTESEILALNDYVTGVISNTINAGEVMYRKYIK